MKNIFEQDNCNALHRSHGKGRQNGREGGEIQFVECNNRNLKNGEKQNCGNGCQYAAAGDVECCGSFAVHNILQDKKDYLKECLPGNQSHAQKVRCLPSSIQTILSVPELHRFCHTARGLYRRSGITPCPEDHLPLCEYYTI